MQVTLPYLTAPRKKQRANQKQPCTEKENQTSNLPAYQHNQLNQQEQQQDNGHNQQAQQQNQQNRKGQQQQHNQTAQHGRQDGHGGEQWLETI